MPGTMTEEGHEADVGRLDSDPAAVSNTEDLLADVVQDGQVLRVYLPPGRQELQNILWTARHACTADSQHGYRLHYQPRPLFGIPDHRDVADPPRLREWECIMCYSGLLPVVQRCLHEVGYDTEVWKLQDSLAATLPPPADIPPGNLPADPTVIRLVQKHDRALLRYTPGKVRIDWLVAQVARAWPKLRFFVWTDTKDQAKELKDRLRKRKVSARWTWNGDESLDDVAVGLGRTQYASLQKRDVLIFTDARHVALTGGLHPMLDIGNARVYGLLPRDAVLPHYSLDQIRAVFGFTSLVLPQHGHRLVDPELATLVYCDCGLADTKADAFEIRKNLVWTNDGRNRFLARLVRAFKKKSCTRLKSPSGHLRKLIETSPAYRRIRVLVENLDHAIALGRQLPEASLTLKAPVSLCGLSQPDRSWVADAAGKHSRVQLVLWSDRATLEVAAGDVFIRADSGFEAWCPQLITADRSASPPVLVDVRDKNHPLLKTWARTRREEYSSLGLSIDDKPALDDVGRFLLERLHLRSKL